MIRFGEVSIPEIFRKMNEPGRDLEFEIDGIVYFVKKHSQRYKLFRTKGLRCVSCKKTANAAFLEANVEGERPHINFYLKRPGMKDLLFTKDHILPKSKGGKNCQSNYQPMCQECNSKKGSEC